MITGGTSALGREVVTRALGQGASVFFTYFSAADAAQGLIQKGAVGFRLDLTDMRAIEAFAAEFKQRSERLDILIHNAALVRDHTILNLTEEEWDTVLTADLKAPFYLTRQLLSYFIRRRRGGPSVPARKKILMVTSRAAVTGGTGISNYAAAKAGLIGLVKSLAQELGRQEVLVNAVNPGFMKSRMTADLPPEAAAAHREASPLGEPSDPAEVAEFLLYLCSDRVAQVTGQVFHFESRKIP